MLRGGRFPQGVLSGDPAPGAITLLTLVDDVGGTGQVRLEVARDPDFRRVVARRDIRTSAAINHSVKARVTGLRPHERYWYRFETRNHHSPVGRFQTALPPDSRATVRFGFFSCADYTHGYYNAYAALAREDLDFVVSLGDYIYAEVSSRSATGARSATTRSGARTRTTAGSCARRHAARVPRQVRALPQRRGAAALHQTFPMIAIWDDHEVQNNYAERRRGRRSAAALALLARPPRRRLPGLLRGDAGVPRAAAPDLPDRSRTGARWS